MTPLKVKAAIEECRLLRDKANADADTQLEREPNGTIEPEARTITDRHRVIGNVLIPMTAPILLAPGATKELSNYVEYDIVPTDLRVLVTRPSGHPTTLSNAITIESILLGSHSLAVMAPAGLFDINRTETRDIATGLVLRAGTRIAIVVSNSAQVILRLHAVLRARAAFGIGDSQG